MTRAASPEEDIETRRRRARYRAWHRGTREMDFLLGRFADARLAACDEASLTRLENLMDEQDTDLLKWIMGQEPAPADADRELIGELVNFHAGLNQ